jgi:hypothetical protein
VRWCPGCGDYAILKAVQKTLAEVGADPDNPSSSRHRLRRALSLLHRVLRIPHHPWPGGRHRDRCELANPALDVWLVSGDGDSLSIGGNHLLHLLRRNLDLVYLLFNNEVYGLTKGQASPTSPVGQVTPSTPAARSTRRSMRGLRARCRLALHGARAGCGARAMVEVLTRRTGTKARASSRSCRTASSTMTVPSTR